MFLQGVEVRELLRSCNNDIIFDVRQCKFIMYRSITTIILRSPTSHYNSYQNVLTYVGYGCCASHAWMSLLQRNKNIITVHPMKHCFPTDPKLGIIPFLKFVSKSKRKIIPISFFFGRKEELWYICFQKFPSPDHLATTP